MICDKMRFTIIKIQARRIEVESEKARLLWADTPSPLPNLESLTG